ncbi:MAG: hypothetical protein IJ080_06010 [Oscillospiraceae bacterium]|nr:hypothetical protein [Oscillospiraceae bacterium]MBQ8979297.1 hypothetical protein [Oscillospiraceae bacterium]
MIKFHLPDFCGNYRMNLYIADLLKASPHLFYDDIKIASSYGCFPPALWNGGRTTVGAVRREFIPFLISEYRKRGIPIRYTFTNPTLKEKDLADPFCNMITKMAEDGTNEIIVNLPLLEEYIRKNYPRYPLISSTVKQIEKEDDLLKELEKDYKLVVLDYNHNNTDILERLPHRDKIELLVNPYCMPHCRRRGDHYRFLGERQAAESRMVFEGNTPAVQKVLKKEFACPNMNMSFYDTVHYDTHITPESIYGKLTDMGYSNFKIEGRMMHAVDILESYMYYMVRPEHRDRVRLSALRELMRRS